MNIYKATISGIFMMLLLTFKTSAQQLSLANRLVLKETSFDFGKIPQGKPVFHEFEITNVGNTTSQITDVQASCGCTTPVWKKEAMMPGAKTVIKIGYNAADAGSFDKTITVFYGQGETLLITIKGEVWRTPDQPAPSNKSVEFLKKLKFNQL